MNHFSPTLCSLPLESLLRICRMLSSRCGTQQSAARRDLTSLALTCRFLSEPAFDTLWHTIGTLGPLLCTLPQDLCTTVEIVRWRMNHHGSYNFKTESLLVSAPSEHAFFFDDFPHTTPSGLLHLARYCPRLIQLALAVNMCGSPHSHPGLCTRHAFAPPLHLSGSAAHALRKLDMSGSLLGERANVASVLSLLFPQLDTLVTRSAQLDLKVPYTRLVRMRAQERAYAEKEGKRLRKPDLSVTLEDVFGL